MTLYFAPGKRSARIAATPQLRATRDGLFATSCRAIVLYCMPGGEARPERMTRAIIDYQARKHAALKAAYFTQRYGRDYFSGRPRHPYRFRVLRAEALRASDD